MTTSSSDRRAKVSPGRTVVTVWPAARRRVASAAPRPVSSAKIAQTCGAVVPRSRATSMSQGAYSGRQAGRQPQSAGSGVRISQGDGSATAG